MGDPRDDMDGPVIDQAGNSVLDPKKALAEPTLAVDLAAVEFDRLIATAHRFPRIIKTMEAQIEGLATHNEAAAENSVYALPRGGKAIVGPSIGFANIVASAWGNCWDHGRWVYTDRKEKVVVCEGVFIDWQSNRRLSTTEQRRIVGSSGRIYTDDMIIITSKAATQIARRNAILNAVPRALWFPSYEKALFMVRGEEKTLPERRSKAIKAMANFGIDPKKIYMYLNVKDEGEIGIEHMPTLRGMFAQLRDGSVTPEEMFDPRRMMGRGFDMVDNPLGGDGEGEAPAVPAGGVETRGAEPDSTAGLGEAPEAARTEGVAVTGKQAAGELPLETGGKAPGPGASAQAPAAAQSAGDSAPAKAGPVVSEAAVARSAKPAAQQEATPAKPAAAAAAAPAENDEPTNPAEYVAEWLAFCSTAASAAAIQKKWADERALRKGLGAKSAGGFSEEQFTECTSARARAEARLAG
jgi:hypothetical protein